MGWITKIVALIKLLKDIFDIFKPSPKEPEPRTVPARSAKDVVDTTSWFKLVQDEVSGKTDILAVDSKNNVVKRYEDVLNKSDLVRIFALHPNAHTFRVEAAADPLPPPVYAKPSVKWYPSPKYSSRKTAVIDTIVLHYTVSETIESARETLTKPVSQGGRVASAHYIVGRNGAIEQLVSEQNKAWHAPKVNSRSIGIEHVAMPGTLLAPEQEKASVALLKYLLQKYKLPYTAITGHKHTGQATACPGNLFGPEGTFAELDEWRKKHFAAEFPA